MWKRFKNWYMTKYIDYTISKDKNAYTVIEKPGDNNDSQPNP